MFVSLVNLIDYSTELTVQYHHKRGFPGGSVGKEPACNAGDTRDAGLIPGSGIPDPLEEGMETHSSILAWRIPWTEEPGRLQSIGSQSAGHD